MMTIRNFRLILGISLIFYPFVVLVMLKPEDFGNTPLTLIISLVFTFLGVSVLWFIGKFSEKLSGKLWKREEEPEMPEPTNFKEVIQETISEMLNLPVVGEGIATIIALFPMGIVVVLNEDFGFLNYDTSVEIIVLSLITLIWVEILEKEFKILLCIPYLPIPIKYACYFIIGGNLIVRGIEWLGIHDFG